MFSENVNLSKLQSCKVTKLHFLISRIHLGSVDYS